MDGLFAALCVLMLVEEIAFHRKLQRAAVGPPAVPTGLARYPSVTVVRPVKGSDVDAPANLRAALDTGYPGEVETLFVFDDAGDAGLPAVLEAVQEHRAAGRAGRAEVLVAGPPPPRRTGKLNAMIVGAARARGELIAFGDSDTRPDRQVLRVLVETLLASPRAGSAFAPTVVPDAPRTSGDVGYATMINALYGPTVAFRARAQGHLPFIMGQLMLFRRDTLSAIGGLACADGHLVDDMHLGACVAKAGLENVMAPHRLAIRANGMAFGQFMRLYRRWLLFSRNGLPWSFTWPLWTRGLQFWVASLILVGALVTHRPLIALLALVLLVWQGASLVLLQRTFGGGPLRLRHWAMPLALFALAPVLLLSTVARRRVNWRGRDYGLDYKAHLA